MHSPGEGWAASSSAPWGREEGLGWTAGTRSAGREPGLHKVQCPLLWQQRQSKLCKTEAWQPRQR